MGDLWNDVKHALQMFIKNPGFTLAAVAALALGIGANTAIFTVVNAVLLKPLTYPDADRIVQIRATGRGWQRRGRVDSEVSYLPAADQHLQGSGGLRFRRAGLQHHRRPCRNRCTGFTSPKGYFRLFGAPVMLGRTFTQQEDMPNGGKVVVISYGLWQRKFGGNPKVIGSSLSLGNEPYTIIGVLGEGFYDRSRGGDLAAVSV